MSASVVFVSDVHLRPDRPLRTARFLQFLQERVVPQGASLIVAGDLFDWLYGVPGMVVDASVAEVVRALEALPAVLWLEGNHDLLLSSVLGEASPIARTAGAVDFVAGSLAIHVAHGDLVDAGDRGYRLFRSLLRGFPGQSVARLLGPSATQRIGDRAAARSRAAQGGEEGHSGQSARWLAAAQDYAAARGAAGADLTVLGHGHWLGWWPGLVCLGDWLRWCSYLQIDAAGARLLRYAPEGDLEVARGPKGAAAGPV